MPPTITAKGFDGTIEFDGAAVTIRREGFNAKAQHRGGGSVTVPLEQVAAVEFKAVSMLTGGNRNWRGRITIVVAGAPPRTDSKRSSRMDDPFTVEFGRHAGEFEAVRDAINGARNSRETAPQFVAVDLAPASLAEQLAQLGQLRSQGVLTDSEFMAAKARLLGS